MNWFIDQEVELTKGAIAGEKRTNITPLAYPGSANAHVWSVTVLNNGHAADLTGATATAYFQRSDGGSPVAVVGTITGNRAEVTFATEVYTIPGIVKAIMNLTVPNTSVITIAALTFRVNENITNNPIDPSGEITLDVGALISDIEDAVASIPSDYSDLLDTIAPTFSSSASYSAGQIVWYDGTLYRFTADHSGTWAAGDVTAITVSGTAETAVRYDAIQALTDTQRERARGNIGAVSDDEYAIINPVNWYNKDDFTIGTFAANGTTSTNESYKYTNYLIPVSSGDVVRFNRGDTFGSLYIRHVTTYDADKQIVSSKGSDSSITQFAVPSGISFVRVTVDNLNNMERYKPLLTVGESMPTEYNEYFEPYTQMDSANPYITPEMFGAYGDGKHDDTEAIQDAIDLGFIIGVPVILSKTYGITETLNAKGRITGKGEVHLLDQDTRLAGAFFSTVGDTIIDGITIDCKSTVAFTVEDKFTKYNVGIFHQSGELTVNGCTFKNVYNRFIYIDTDTVNNVLISNCIFDATNKSNRFMSYCIGASNIINSNAIITIKNNQFYGYVGTDDTLDNASAVVVSNVLIKKIIITENTMINMGRLATYGEQVGYSRLCAIDFYFNAQNIWIEHNKILQCNWVPIRVHGATNIHIIGNEISISKYINEPVIWISDAKNSTGEAPTGVDNVVIANNTISTKTNTHAASIFQIDSTPRHSETESLITRVIIHNNIISNIYCEHVFLIDNTVKECCIDNNHITIDKTGLSTAPILLMCMQSPEGENYDDMKLQIFKNVMLMPVGTGINLVNAIMSSNNANGQVEITENRIHVSSNYCILGAASESTPVKITAIANILSGTKGIKNAETAIRNISSCTTENYSSITEAHENYPNS